MNQLCYYKWIHDPAIGGNFNHIPYNLESEWFGAKLPKEMQLHLNHPLDAPEVMQLSNGYYRIKGCFIENTENDLCRKAILWLEGDNIFAMIEVNLDKKPIIIKAVKFSPVPFGLDCKPKLPHIELPLPTFLALLKVVLQRSTWTAESLLEVAVFNGIIKHESDILPKISAFLHELDFLSVTNNIRNGEHTIDMSSSEFEEIFGVKLPIFDVKL